MRARCNHGSGHSMRLSRPLPLTVAEQQQQRPVRPLIDRIAGGEPLATTPGPAPDLRGYLELALRGGFPEPALELGERTARAWLESYADRSPSAPQVLPRTTQRASNGRAIWP